MGVTVIASTSQVLWRILESYRQDPAVVFRAAGLDPQLWNEPDSRFDDDRLDAAWAHAVELTGDPCLGLRAARFINPGSLQALGFAWLVSDSLYDAMQRLVRYFRMISDGVRLELAVSGDDCRLAVDRSYHQGKAKSQRMDAFWASMIAMCRMNLSDDFVPTSLTLVRPPPPCAADFYSLFRTPIEFSAARDVMTVARKETERPLPTANRLLARANDRVIADYLAKRDADNFSNRVRTRLVEMLPGGTGAEEQVARALNVSRRTLQRRLADEETSYKSLLDAARRELAVHYLGDHAMSINEVAYMLGYSEPGNFSRAFKRWTGELPSRYRDRRSA